MTNQYEKLTESFDNKLSALLKLHRETVEQNQQLAHDLQQKQDDLRQAHTVISELRSDYENLKLAQAMGGNAENRELVHKRITQLVREIDKCIDLLNR